MHLIAPENKIKVLENEAEIRNIKLHKSIARKNGY